MIYDVVIAGGGPVGLFLSCELRLAGVSVLVLERLEDPRSPLKASWMGMRGLNFPSVEAFYRRGMLKALRECALGWMSPERRTGIEMNGAAKSDSAPAPRFGGHFAGIMLDPANFDFSGHKYVLGGPSASGGVVSLEALELLLAEHAQELGVELRRGVTVTGFSEEGNLVTVHADEESFQGRWLVGCDGGRSTVRKLAGFEFAGTDPELTGYTALVDLDDPAKLRPGFNLTENGLYVNGPGPGRIGVVEFDDASFDRSTTITCERLQKILRHVSGTDVTITTLHVASSYTDRARQATTYRKGRVLLAGDAAHVHSPFGGQGLNTGIGDAMNLGWKLAATIKGTAPEGLLDSYTSERHPVGAWALNWTRAQVAIMRPDPHARAIAGVIRDLINTRDGATYFVDKISGASLRYNLPSEDATDSHPLIGHSAPDFEFEDATRLGFYLHQGNGLLVDFTDSGELHSLAQRWSRQVKYLSAKTADSKGLTALLVRPDGFVAWATEAQPNPGTAESSMKLWFGDAS
jgi:2-polyprenyl-6-methoxyphenol hydroxylase-like FAD-dependent oxidoreductase